MISCNNFCCTDMEHHIHTSRIISYSEVLDEYGIRLTEDDCSVILIEHCPWCGTKLPESKRIQWFERLEELGFEDPLDSDDIPAEFKSAGWRQSV